MSASLFTNIYTAQFFSWPVKIGFEDSTQTHQPKPGYIKCNNQQTERIVCWRKISIFEKKFYDFIEAYSESWEDVQLKQSENFRIKNKLSNDPLPSIVHKF